VRAGNVAELRWQLLPGYLLVPNSTHSGVLCSSSVKLTARFLYGASSSGWGRRRSHRRTPVLSRWSAGRWGAHRHLERRASAPGRSLRGVRAPLRVRLDRAAVQQHSWRVRSLRAALAGQASPAVPARSGTPLRQVPDRLGAAGHPRRPRLGTRVDHRRYCWDAVPVSAPRNATTGCRAPGGRRPVRGFTLHHRARGTACPDSDLDVGR
jgi:hypothetical protein